LEATFDRFSPLRNSSIRQSSDVTAYLNLKVAYFHEPLWSYAATLKLKISPSQPSRDGWIVGPETPTICLKPQRVARISEAAHFLSAVGSKQNQPNRCAMERKPIPIASEYGPWRSSGHGRRRGKVLVVGWELAVVRFI
jgi:hypothetical protein